VKEFKYLEYVLQKNGGQEAHIKDRVRRQQRGWGKSGDLKRGDSEETGEGGYDFSTN